MKIRILAAFANPKGTDQLRLGEEEKVIKECIKLSKHRDNIELVTCHATTIDDISRELLQNEFDVIHISGHGTGRGLVFEDASGNTSIPKPKALADLFKTYSPPINCVILNSCYSSKQGYLTALGVPYTIAMDNSISDLAAIEFTRGFYDAIGANRDVCFAFDEGRRRILLKHFDILQLPILLKQSEVLALPKEKLPVILDTGEAVFPEDIATEGFCSCEQLVCTGKTSKVYCYTPKWMSSWVIGKRLYWRCYDEVILCPRCGCEHKRGHIGKLDKCENPYRNQKSQTD